MTALRYGSKVDANQQEIVEALRRAGAFVWPTFQLGRGAPDLVVAFRDVWYVAELKRHEEGLTPREQEWHGLANKHARVHVWRTAEQALRTIGAT